MRNSILNAISSTHHGGMNKPPAIDVIQEIIRLIGDEAAERLIDRFSGVSLDVHNYRAEIEDLIGAENRCVLIAYYGRLPIYIPLRRAKALSIRNSAVRTMFDEKTALGMSARKAVIAVAREFKISERYVWSLLKKVDE